MKKVRRVIALLLVIAVLATVCPNSTFATEADLQTGADSEIAVYGDYTYTLLEDGTAAICGYTGTPDSGKEGCYLEIPSSVDGVAVTQIAEEAFAYNDVIDAVLIPEGITSVGNAAFYHCSGLRAIAFCGNAPAFGFTVAEGSHALEKVFALESSDISMFCSLLVNDLGEDRAKNVEIVEFESLSTLKRAYSEYIASLDAQLRETVAPITEKTALPTETETKETAPSGSEGEAEVETEPAEPAEAETVFETAMPDEANAPISDGEAAETVDVLAEGTCGENLTWVLDANGVLTISGTGDMANYSSGTAPWYSYADRITSLLLNEGITTIGSYAFYRCTEMTGDLVIPDSVTTISNYAFDTCAGFHGTLTLSENLTTLGAFAFLNCSGITGEIVVPDGITAMNVGVFSGMAKVTSLVFSENMADIYTGFTNYLHAFYGMTSLKEITFNSLKVPTIGSYTPFPNMTSLETVYVPAASYADYAARYKSYLPSSARLTSIGAASDFQVEDTVLVAYLGDGGDVVIPDEVTEIGTSAFQNCTSLTKVTIPSSVVAIGAYAFNGCTGLNEIVFSEGLERISDSAFTGCGNLTELSFPSTLTNIGASAFQNCTGLSGLALPENLSIIGSYAFSGCTGMTGGLTIPGSVSSMGEYAFQNCTGLDGKLIIEAGEAKTIGSYAFSGCKKLTGVELGNGITTLGNYTFSNCSAMAGDLVIPDSVTIIGDYAFYNCKGFQGTLTLPENLTKLGAFAFQNCSGITGEIVVPDGITVMNQGVFSGMAKVTSLVFSENMADIYTSATNYNHAFYGMTSLKEITFNSLKVPTIDSDTPFPNMTSLETVYVPAASYADYAARYKSYLPSSARLTSIGAASDFQIEDTVLVAYLGDGGDVVIPDEVTEIGTSAFQNCTALTKVTIPSSVVTIGAYAFKGCTGLTGGLTIPGSVTSMGEYAFQNCTGLDGKLIIEAGEAKTIGSYAFSGCKKLTGVELGNGITTIGSYAFSNCTGMAGDLVIPDSVTAIRDYAFYNCTSFHGTLTLSENLTTLGAFAFQNCSGITGEIVVPDGITVMNQGVFSGMAKVTSLVFGENMADIYTSSTNYNHAFYGMTSLKEITFNSLKVPTIDSCTPFPSMTSLETVYVPAASYADYAARYKSYLPGSARLTSIGAASDFQIEDTVLVAYLGDGGDVVIPDEVTEIGTSAFQNCTSLTKVTIPSSVVSIGTYAFNGCTSLREIVFAEGLERISDFAFAGCTRLTGLSFPSTLTSIGASAFEKCTGMTGGLTIPGSVSSIGAYAFQNCTGLDGKLIIEAGEAKTIGLYAFSGCNRLTGVVLGNGITAIGSHAFIGCTGMTGDLVIPDSVTIINSYAFYNCTGFNGTLTLSENLTDIYVYAFYNCKNITGELVIPDRVTEIGSYAFQRMSSLTSIVLGEGLSWIGSTGIYDSFSPFYDCPGIKEVTFHSLTVPQMHGNMFSSMTSLETVYVPAASYDAYVAAYSSYVSDSVAFSSDFLTAKVTNLAASNVYSKTVILTWNAHTSNRVVGYTVERDGAVVGTTTACNFTDRGLTTGTTYTYSVYGYTEDGSTTGIAEIKVTPLAPNILDIRTDNTSNKVGVRNTIYIRVSNHNNWDDYGGETAAANLYYLKGEKRVLIGEAIRDPSLGSSSVAVFTVAWDITDIDDGDYELLFSITDIDGTTDTYRKTVTVDRSVPAQIVGVTAIGDITVIHLTWAISSEADTTIYRIYRRAESDEAFSMIAQIKDRDTLTYTDKNVKTGRIYYYYVVGVNEFGQEGEASAIAGATLSDDTEAPIVTKLSPANASYLTGTAAIGLTAQDNVSVTQAELYYSLDGGAAWTLFGRSPRGSFTASLDTRNLADGEIRIKGIAYDAAGNESSALTYVYRIDNTGPEQVQGLRYESTDVTVTLSWNDVADDDIRFYRVERKMAEDSYSQVTDVYHTLGANIYNLTPGSSYIYRVVGYDTQGNRGTPSDDITVKTKSDTTAPVITKIRPTSGYYSSSISLSITATDEYNVAAITLQTSTDGIIWRDVYGKNYLDVSKSRTLSYTLSLDSYPEGYLFVRAIAADGAGNESDSSKTAPYVQHMIDKTAPAAPERVTAIGNSGYIEVAWVQGAETDLDKYAVYRAEAADGTFELLKSGIAAINYIDRDVEEGVVYYYKVAVNDKAGNTSEFSQIVSAEVIKDTEAPEIVSVYPENRSSIGSGYRTVGVLATDNNALDSILIEYSKDGSAYSALYKLASINTYSKTVTATIPVSEFSDGAAVYIRVSAADKSGNQSETFTTQYVVDAVAPTAANATAAYADECVYIRWTGNQEADLIGYRIYRKTGVTGSYRLIAQRQAVDGQADYSCCDYDLSLEKTTYIYKVEAVDECGNTSSVITSAVEIPDRSAPKPVISCEATLEVGVEYYIDATSSTDNSAIVSYLFDFGDGTTSTERKPTHTYTETGEYTITLTVTDDDGNQATCTKMITVKDRALLGTAKIRIVDENGVAVAGAPVYFDLGEETQVMKTTDSSGYVTFTAEVGKHTVGCVIADNEWLPVKKDIIITAGEETFVSMTLVHHVMIEGQFEITRMTFEEIVAAGIDVSDPENQYMVKVNVTLTYGADTVETSFTYNETTGKTIAKPTIVSTSDGEKRQIVPVVLSTNKSSGGIGTGGDYTFSSEASIAYLDIPVGVSSLKEFFNVNLHIINHASSEFSMIDNVIELNVPDGLTLMETYATESNSTVTIAEIKGQTTETITWILRGDQIGTYYLTADYSGILSEFDEPIYTQFVATEPIEVYGLSNLKLTIEIPDELDHGTFYYNISLGNEGKVDVYRPNLDTGDTLIETQLFDAAGADITDIIALDAEEIDEYGLATSIEGVLDVLPAGSRLTKHYMCIDQTSYTELELKLKDYAYEVQNTYGLEIEFVTRPVSYFKSNLSANINAAEKAELTFTTNQSAFDYLMTNENYIYWSMYASTGAVATALTTNAQENMWELLKFAAGDGDFKALFGADDEELIQAIILDAMEISVESEDYSKYYAICDWTTLVKDWVKKEGHGEWINIVTKWVNKTMAGAAEEVIAQKIEEIGESLPYTFELIAAEYKWEAYKAVYEGEYLDFDNFVVGKWQMVIDEYYYESTEIYQETDGSQMLHELFSREGFSTIWKAMGIGLKAAKKIVSACEETSTDISLYFAAQSNLDSCNLFLDTISNYMYDSSSDASKVAKAAIKIKETINELDPVGSLAEHLLDEAFWMGVDYAKDGAMKKLNLSPNAFVQAIKTALKMTVYIGNNVFHVDDRHDIADNIRFVSCMTIALRYGIWDAQAGYQNNRTDDTAQRYMQLISYLLNIRAIGESQVAQFGITYEVLPGVFDSAELFYTVRDMSGAAEATSWLQWRDFVEDKISMLRVQLLKNPLTTSAAGITAPEVAFDYAAGQTAQTFSSDYEYSLNGGSTWTTCNGTAISVPPQPYSIKLMVRRVDSSSSSEKMTSSVMIYGASSLEHSGINVLRTEDGYQVTQLDHTRTYEVTFSQVPIAYGQDNSLAIRIPAGSQSYSFQTSAEYSYVYIRAIADANHYATYVYSPAIYEMTAIDVSVTGQGTVTGAGKYAYGAEATLVAVPASGYSFDGWYENGERIEREATISLRATENRQLSAVFTLSEDAIDVTLEHNLVTLDFCSNVEGTIQFYLVGYSAQGKMLHAGTYCFDSPDIGTSKLIDITAWSDCSTIKAFLLSEQLEPLIDSILLKSN